MGDDLDRILEGMNLAATIRQALEKIVHGRQKITGATDVDGVAEGILEFAAGSHKLEDAIKRELAEATNQMELTLRGVDKTRLRAIHNSQKIQAAVKGLRKELKFEQADEQVVLNKFKTAIGDFLDVLEG